MFLVHRSSNGLRLLQNDRAVPVSDSYLEVLCREAGVTLNLGEVAIVPMKLAFDAIEEALGRISFEIATAEAHKKALLRHFLATAASA